MICNSCGQEIEDNSSECRYCGASIAAPAKKKVNVTAVIGFIIGLASIGLSYYLCIASVVGIIVNIAGLCLRKKYRLNGFAIAGLVISILSLIGWGIFWYIIIAIIKGLGSIKFNT